MAASGKVTVDKVYFDALLRRADFHTSPQILGYADPSKITIPRVEHDSLLRASHEYEVLKNALFQGGITTETLDLLISGTGNNEARKDSGISINTWTDEFKDQVPTHDSAFFLRASASAPYAGMPRRPNGSTPTFNLAPGSGPYRSNNGAEFRTPNFQRQASLALSSVDDTGFDDQDDLANGRLHGEVDVPHGERRTLYLTGFSERTTYRDLLSIIRGGKVVSIVIRAERSAMVTLQEGAAEFLASAKRNDIYLHAKRVEIKWADRQFQVNGHINNKIAGGATRNILIHNASRNGLTEAQIREDMDHIHNLVIVDVTFRNGDAHVSTNSIHNALFARTCMLSRSTYKGCKIAFYPDECDMPLPARLHTPKPPKSKPLPKKPMLANRFGCLDIGDGEGSSDEENRVPLDCGSEDDETVDLTSGAGVSLNFLDSESP